MESSCPRIPSASHVAACFFQLARAAEAVKTGRDRARAAESIMGRSSLVAHYIFKLSEDSGLPPVNLFYINLRRSLF